MSTLAHSLLGTFSSHMAFNQSQVLTYSQQKSTLKKQSHTQTLIIPHHTLVRESLTSDTPPPPALASPVQPCRVGRGSTSFAPQTCTGSFLHSSCRRVHHLSRPPGPPPHQPAHTYGKLPEVINLPSPHCPRGTSIRLSGSKKRRQGRSSPSRYGDL